MTEERSPDYAVKFSRADHHLAWPLGTHPLDQAHLWFPHKLYDWQADALAAFALPRSRAIISTNNESGKTSTLIPIAGLSVMCAFPGASVFATSGSERQVKEQLFLDNVCPIVEKLKGWKITRSDPMKVTAPNGSTWLFYVCRDEKNVEGFHGKWSHDGSRYIPCVYFLDECKSIPDGVEEAVRRIDPDFCMAVSSPGDRNGWFFKGIDPDGLR